MPFRGRDSRNESTEARARNKKERQGPEIGPPLLHYRVRAQDGKAYISRLASNLPYGQDWLPAYHTGDLRTPSRGESSTVIKLTGGFRVIVCSTVVCSRGLKEGIIITRAGLDRVWVGHLKLQVELSLGLRAGLVLLLPSNWLCLAKFGCGKA